MTIASQLTSINNSKQAIKTAIEAKGVTVGTAAFDQYATKISEIVTAPAGPAVWTRNPSWLALPTVTDTENKFVGLHLVNRDSNFLALQATTSGGAQYQVDWGDGSVELWNSATTAPHQYDFADADIPNSTRAPVTFTDSTNLVTRTAHGYTNGQQISFDEITSTTGIVKDGAYYVINATANTFQLSLSQGGSAIDLVTNGSGFILPYKQVIVVITPVSGNFTNININLRHSSLTVAYSTGWLDCVLSAPSLTGLIVGASAPNVRHGNLERFSLLKSNLTTFANQFNNCTELRNVPNLVPAASGNIACNNMFQNCYNLTHWPAAISGFSSRITSLDTAFRDCNSLSSVPALNLPIVTNLNALLQDCNSVTTVGTITTGTALTSLVNTFFNCRSLAQAPAISNTVNVNNMSDMFNGGQSLVSVPLYDTGNVTGMANMFIGCASLTTVPLFNTIKVTSMASMFNGCSALTEVPFFDTRAVTTMNGMFASCRSLRTIPPFNAGLVTNVASMFINCFALEAIPSLNLGSGVTTFSSFAQNCQSLETVGTISLTGPTSSTGLNNIITACPSLSRLGGTNARFTHTIANCKLSAAELNNYYTNLPSVTSQTLTVSGNWGVATDTISIATAKGWTISG